MTWPWRDRLEGEVGRGRDTWRRPHTLEVVIVVATRWRRSWSWSRHAGGGRGRGRDMAAATHWRECRHRRRRDVAITMAAHCCFTYPPSPSPRCPLTPLYRPWLHHAVVAGLPALVHPCQPALVPALDVRVRSHSFVLVGTSPFSTYQN